MPEMETGFAFRKDMYKHMGMKLPDVPPKKVLFMLRANNRRKMHNLPELLKIVESYNLSYSYVPPPVSYRAHLPPWLVLRHHRCQCHHPCLYTIFPHCCEALDALVFVQALELCLASH